MTGKTLKLPNQLVEKQQMPARALRRLVFGRHFNCPFDSCRKTTNARQGIETPQVGHLA